LFAAATACPLKNGENTKVFKLNRLLENLNKKRQLFILEIYSKLPGVKETSKK
jgi:hypothetical protein